MKKILFLLLTITSSCCAKEYFHIANNTSHPMYIKPVPLSYERERTVKPFSTDFINITGYNLKAVAVKDTELKDPLRANQQIKISPVGKYAIVINPLIYGKEMYGFVIKQRTKENATIVLNRQSPPSDDFIKG